MDTSVAATTPLTSRRYGVINWLGLQTLIQREVQRFLKVGAQTVFAPLIQTLLFMLVFSLVRGGDWPGTTRAYADGLAAGLVMMSILSNAFQNSSSSIVIAKVQGNAVDFLMPPLSALELTIAFIVGAAARGMLVGLASLIVVSWLANIVPAHPLVALYYGLVASVIFGAIGLLGGIWADKFDHLAAVTNFIIVPLTFLSGTFYSTSILPEPIRTISHYNPVFSLIDGFRYGFIGHADAPLLIGAAISGGLALALCVACWAMLKSGYRLRS
jgi:ABC-2 type transport system permease protein